MVKQIILINIFRIKQDVRTYAFAQKWSHNITSQRVRLAHFTLVANIRAIILALPLQFNSLEPNPIPDAQRLNATSVPFY